MMMLAPWIDFIPGCFACAHWDFSSRTNIEHVPTIRTVLDRAHREKYPPCDTRQFEEPILFIESDSRSIFRVYDHACGSDFPAVLKNPVERVHEECLAVSLASEVGAYRQTSDKRCRYHRVFRQSLRDLGRDILELHRILRKRVVTRDRTPVRGQNK